MVGIKTLPSLELLLFMLCIRPMRLHMILQNVFKEKTAEKFLFKNHTGP